MTARVPSPRETPALVRGTQSDLGEGPVWDEHRNQLVWLDLTGGVLHLYDPVTDTDDRASLGRTLGSAVPDGRGGIIIAADGGLFQLGQEGALQLLLTLDEPRTGAIPNDSCCDPAGNLWLGTATMDETPEAGSLYRVSPSLIITKVLTGLTVPNGIDWSPDGQTMYFADSASSRVDAFTFDPSSGSLGEHHIFVSFGPGDGAPDGLTVDAEGYVWVALWGGWSVRRYHPAGQLDLAVRLSVAQVSSCGFGGPSLEDLYITTAAYGLDDKSRRAQPAAGGLFRYRAPVPGRPVQPFRAQTPATTATNSEPAPR